MSLFKELKMIVVAVVEFWVGEWKAPGTFHKLITTPLLVVLSLILTMGVVCLILGMAVVDTLIQALRGRQGV